MPRWPSRAPATRDLRVLDVAQPLAYCLPGVRSRVVVSEGTLNTLDRRRSRGHPQPRAGPSARPPRPGSGSVHRGARRVPPAGPQRQRAGRGAAAGRAAGRRRRGARGRPRSPGPGAGGLRVRAGAVGRAGRRRSQHGAAGAPAVRTRQQPDCCRRPPTWPRRRYSWCPPSRWPYRGSRNCSGCSTSSRSARPNTLADRESAVPQCVGQALEIAAKVLPPERRRHEFVGFEDRHRADRRHRPGRDGFEPRPQFRPPRLHGGAAQPVDRQDRRAAQRARRRGQVRPVGDHRGIPGRAGEAAAGDHHGQGRRPHRRRHQRARRRHGRRRHHHRRRQRALHRHHPPREGDARARPALRRRRASPAARRAR